MRHIFSDMFGEILTTGHNQFSLFINSKGVDNLSVRKLESMKNIAVLIRELNACIIFKWK